MVYPSAPWTLRGYALQTLQLVDTTRTRRLVPSDLQIVSVLPGKTLGGVYLACYGPGSVLEYNELIVAAALTRCARRLGFWISHIYVDDADSLAGGREIWGLPKELAQFAWEKGKPHRVLVRQEDCLLCVLECGHPRWLWRQRLTMPSLTTIGSDFLSFKGEIKARMGIARGHLEVPIESPFIGLGLGRARLTYHYGEMNFVATAPRIIGPRAAQPRESRGLQDL